MHTSMLLEMAADGFGDRTAIGPKAGGLTYADLLDRARRAAVWASARNVERIGLVDVNSDAVPILLYGSGLAGKPFVPINYRLADEQLRNILARNAPAVVVVEDPVPERVGTIEGVELVTRDQFRDELAAVDADEASSVVAVGDPDDIAILLFTSG